MCGPFAEPAAVKREGGDFSLDLTWPPTPLLDVKRFDKRGGGAVVKKEEITNTRKRRRALLAADLQRENEAGSGRKGAG